jgi:hypothetical protein
MAARIIVLLIAALGAGCAPLFDRHRPAGDAPPDDTAVAAAAGVEITTDSDAWWGVPPELTELIPVQVTIENDSEWPLRLGYQDFALVTPSERLSPLPPFDLERAATALKASYAFPWSGFHLAPHLTPFYRGFWTGGWEFAHDPRYYETSYDTLTAIIEPTADMARKALPEGVLEPGGRITGFLYFPDCNDCTRATLVADLVDADSRQRVASVQLSMTLNPSSSN